MGRKDSTREQTRGDRIAVLVCIIVLLLVIAAIAIWPGLIGV